MNANKSLSRRQKLDLNRRKIAAISFLSNIQVGLKGKCHKHKQVPASSAVSDSDPTLHFDADPDPNPDPTPSFTHAGKSDFSLFLFRAVPVYIFIFLVSVILFKIVTYLNFLEKSMVWLYIWLK